MKMFAFSSEFSLYLTYANRRNDFYANAPIFVFYTIILCTGVLFFMMLSKKLCRGKKEAMKTDVPYLELSIGVTLRFLAPAGLLLPTLRVLRRYIFVSVS